MRARLLLPLALVAVLAGGLAVAACSDQSSPVAPDPTEGLVPAGIADAQTIQEIRILFKNRLFALGFYAAIRIAAFTGNEDAAIEHALDFLRFAISERNHGRIRNPKDGRTRDEAIIDLFERIFHELGVAAPPFEGIFGTGDFVIGRVGPEGGKVTVPSGHAAIAFAPGDLTAGTWIVIAGLPNPSSPGGCPFGFPVDGECYPLFFDYEIFPESNLAGTPVIGQCVVDTGPLAPPPGVEDDLVIASEDHESPGTLILWPVVEAPSTVDCSDLAFGPVPDDWRADLWAALGPVNRLFDVRPAWANPGKLGASISSFSPFAPFDAEDEEEPPPPPPPPPTEGVVRGKVVEFGDPVSSAVVDLIGPGEFFRSDTTGTNGRFRFEDVPFDEEGTTYTVSVSARQGSDSEEVTLSPEEPEANVTLDVGTECCVEASSRAPAAD